ncbi:DUF4861 family protein [Rubrivirga sp. S365]|uniref:DUF4861 family protein n=1 Tax=Rubrivirga sp. S365 TaxID=3076080 RepID=UPI0028C5BDED|nr:DUF4861 family protein [Rubrivirga sp. S365]MDT7856553.1 DUF4861 family protein [Rubrivirga sp. S365]
MTLRPAPLLFALTLLLAAAPPVAAQGGAAQVSLRVENPAATERPDEIVSVDWEALQRRLPAARAGRVRVLDAEGGEAPSQVLDDDGDGTPDALLFLAPFWPGQARTFTVEAAPPAPVEARAHVLRDARRDDLAWENDRVAFRTYGAGLSALEDLVSSGVDVWTKRTDALVADRWYAEGDYHTDTGEGADFFSVGRSLGAGGTAVWAGGALHPAPNFTAHRILADGPLRAVAELTYPTWDAAGRAVTETRRITVDAGQPVYRQESVFESDGEAPLQTVVGLVHRPGMVTSTRGAGRWTWLSGWGPVGNEGHGDLGTAVLVRTDRVAEHAEAEDHSLLVTEAEPGTPFVAYVGAGWTANDVGGVEEWWATLDDAAERLAHPLRVSFPDDALDAQAALDAAAERLRPFLDRPARADEIPRSIDADGALDVSPSREWTSGFYAGTLWELYDATGDPAFEDAARRWTAVVEPEKTNAGTHDMGFKIYPTAGAGLRLTGDDDYRDVVVEAAETLLTRFDANVGATRSWDWGNWKFPVIIDNMMNLELLYAASELTGDDKFARAATEHARTTLANHFRPDDSSYHVVQYDSLGGEVLYKGTHQGFSDASAWSRGQAWGLYGFAMAYRESGEADFLAQAQSIADYVLAHPQLPGDGVPYWDFDAPALPDEPRDASAAAVLASGLYELAGFVPEPERGRYVAAADRILTSLATDYRVADDYDQPFLLDHSVGSVPDQFEVDVPIVYADYYYVEALQRRLRLDEGRPALGAR